MQEMPPKIRKMKSLQAVLQKDAQLPKQKEECPKVVAKRKVYQTQSTTPSTSILARSDDIEVPVINLVGNFFEELYLFFVSFMLLSYLLNSFPCAC